MLIWTTYVDLTSFVNSALNKYSYSLDFSSLTSSNLYVYKQNKLMMWFLSYCQSLHTHFSFLFYGVTCFIQAKNRIFQGVTSMKYGKQCNSALALNLLLCVIKFFGEIKVVKNTSDMGWIFAFLFQFFHLSTPLFFNIRCLRGRCHESLKLDLTIFTRGCLIFIKRRQISTCFYHTSHVFLSSFSVESAEALHIFQILISL